MILAKLNYKSKYLRLYINYKNYNLRNKIKTYVYCLLKKYGNILIIKEIEKIINNEYYLYYFIYINSNFIEVIEIHYFNLLINTYLLQNFKSDNIYIYFGCDTKHQFYKELNKIQ